MESISIKLLPCFSDAQISRCQNLIQLEKCSKSFLIMNLSIFKYPKQKMMSQVFRFEDQYFGFIINNKGTEMAQRLEFLSQKIKKTPPPYVDSSFDYLFLSSMLTAEENKARQKIRQFVESQIVPTIDPYVQEATFPEYLLPKLKNLNILHYFFRPPYGLGFSTAGLGTLIAQLSRGDAGVCTMVLVQWALLGSTIEILGSHEQKQKYLPKIKNFQMIGGWGLTEDKIGSDASNIHTAVTKISDDKYRIHGNKRWIGNGNRDLLIVWAKNTQTKKVEGFIVENKNAQGLSSQVIKYKLPLRIVQNCHITFNNVVVSAEQRLPKANDFASGTNVILKHSRIFVCWVAAGIAMGVYDNAIKYVSNRKQFGHPISGFQLVQDKIVRIMANTQAIFLLCFRVSKLIDDGKATMGQIAMTKAWVTERAREVARLGRQVFGGNGITHENYVMKALADMEAIYTYEGTYDINTLVAGRQLTGLSAFK